MTPNHPAARLLTPTDDEIAARAARLRELGLGQGPDQEFDAFAADLAEKAADLVGVSQKPYTMVNFITDQQFFAGLYVPSAPNSPAMAGQAPSGSGVSRIMPRDHGFCPHVVIRRLPLVLDDVCEYPRFAGNPVVDEIGIRTYLGAPLIDHTGIALGTICVVDTEQRPWGRPGLEFIKARAADLMARIESRDRPIA